MTMTREEALTIVTSIVREHSRECREPKPCQDCELEAEAIAALSAQEPVAGWASELELAELQRDMAKNNQVTCIISLASRQSAHKRIPLYAAPPAQADTKQAEPVSPWLQALATVNRLHNLGDAIYDVRRYASENDSEYTGSSWEHPDVLAYSAAVEVLNAALATLPAPPALRQLGANAQVDKTEELSDLVAQQADTKQAEPLSPWLPIESQEADK